MWVYSEYISYIMYSLVQSQIHGLCFQYIVFTHKDAVIGVDHIFGGVVKVLKMELLFI